jgi:probable rRNA maturation factor
VGLEFIYEIGFFKLDDVNKYRKWLIEVARRESKVIQEINIVFVNEERILDINKKFLKHNYITDIITFNNSFLSKLSGEIYISIPTVEKNSKIYSNKIFINEVNRVLVHGLLHLIGYNDQNNNEILTMRSKEDCYLMYLD